MYFDHNLDALEPTAGPHSMTYLVCATPRSGSSLLCELLARTGIAGMPTEYFDPEHMAEFQRRWNVADTAGYMAELRARATTSNGVLGLKAHFDQMDDLFGPTGLTDAVGPLHAIHMVRDDRAAQAVSYSIAVQNERWASTHRGNGTRVRYRPAQIAELAASIERADRGWSTWFERSNIEPLVVRYEALVADPGTTLHRVLDFLGVSLDPPVAVPSTTLRRQRTARSARWAERYRRRLR